LTGARAERNEYLFLHEFHNLKYVVPDKKWLREEPAQAEDSDQENEVKGGGRRKPTYSGGLVLEPKKGLYTDMVMLLDFNSLYPSLIQEFNICFTTVERQTESDEIPSPPDHSLPQGILPRIIYNLVQRRRQVKSMMKDQRLSAEERQQLNIRQQALKLTANSMYGCLGFTHSRFHARPLAALITSKGRQVLQSTVDLAKLQLGLDVVYGDTDSVMINTKVNSVEEAKAMAAKLKKSVNERYKCLEIELDGLFKRLLLLKKKKYAALKVQEDGTCKLETKGLDMVRRDWCPLSVDSCNYCLDLIMGVAAECAMNDIAAIIGKYLADLNQQTLLNQIDVSKFVISKNLTKDPSMYADVKGQPHVSVALRMRERGATVQSGDTIEYVICRALNGGSHASMSERAFHLDELHNDPNLSIGTIITFIDMHFRSRVVHSTTTDPALATSL
jgi:DNA polymerase alpha subunit A